MPENNLVRNDHNFKKAIGEFIIAFSEMEFGLSDLCSFTEFDPRKNESYLTKYMGYNFEKKQTTLKNYIKNELPELIPSWEKINNEIGQINRIRRFIAHGIISYAMPLENVSAYVKENGKIKEEKLTIETIEIFTNQIHEINTGENGILGEFRICFITARINSWNNLVQDEFKSIYTINGEIQTEWSGIKN
jgi:hypothetical protein